MENDIEILRQIAAQGIRFMQVNTLVTGPHDLQTALRLNKFGLYNVRLGHLTRRVERVGDDGVVVSAVEPTSIGTWFGIKPEDAHLWDGVVATKWGVTSVSFRERFPGVVNDLRARRFPVEDLEMEFAFAIVGLPRDFVLLQQLEHGLRNDLGDVVIRLAWHAQGPEVNPGDRTVFSEMFEFARVDGPSDTRRSTVYELYAARLEAARLRYLAGRREREAERARAFRELLRVTRRRHRQERGTLSARHRRARGRLQRQNAVEAQVQHVLVVEGREVDDLRVTQQEELRQLSLPPEVIVPTVMHPYYDMLIAAAQPPRVRDA